MTLKASPRLWALTAAVFALAAATAVAQGRRGGGMGMSGYDPSTETTLTGAVDDVQTHQGRAGGTGTHLVLATSGGPIEVHLGPTNWLSSKRYTFAKGDQLEIVGSKVQIDGKAVLIARQVKRGAETMTFRNELGVPQWSRGRRTT